MQVGPAESRPTLQNAGRPCTTASRAPVRSSGRMVVVQYFSGPARLAVPSSGTRWKWPSSVAKAASVHAQQVPGLLQGGERWEPQRTARSTRCSARSRALRCRSISARRERRARIAAARSPPGRATSSIACAGVTAWAVSTRTVTSGSDVGPMALMRALPAPTSLSICSPRSAASRMMLHTRRMSSEDTEAGGQREHLLGQALGVLEPERGIGPVGGHQVAGRREVQPGEDLLGLSSLRSRSRCRPVTARSVRRISVLVVVALVLVEGQHLDAGRRAAPRCRGRGSAPGCARGSARRRRER